MDYRTLFAEIRRRPGLYGLDGSFEQFTAFVSGVDAGNDWRLLTGFRERLIVRLGDGNRVASETFFQLLDEFLARRAAHDEPAAIFDEYLSWRRAQSWCKPTGTRTSSPDTAPS